MESNSVIRRLAVQAPEKLASKTIELLTLADALAAAMEACAVGTVAVSMDGERFSYEIEEHKFCTAYGAARAYTAARKGTP
jgi:hypothetical protein